MSGYRSRRSTKNSKKSKEQPTMEEVSDHEDGEHEGDVAENMDQNETLRAGLASISNDIRDLKKELRNELTTFKDELKSEMRREVATLRQDIDRKFTESNKEQQEQKTAITEVQARVAEVEECNAEASDLLVNLAKQTRQMQDKLTDLEARSRRNNIRIFGLPEDTEGGSIINYLDQLLKTELELPEGADLRIQRAHRALTRKPGLGGAPRSVIVNFHEFETKEMVLQKVWQKKGIQLGNKKIQFDHDYPTEIVQKRKTYLNIKKTLKEKGIRFQTPYTKMRIYWSDGVRSYDNARDAALDMKARGLTVDEPSEDAELAEERTRGAPGWQRVGYGRARFETVAQRAKDKLQGYQRKPDT